MMTKRLLAIGCTTPGLPEAQTDMNNVAGWLEKFCKIEPTSVVVSPMIDIHDIIDLQPRYHGADLVIIYFDSHGYRTRVGGVIETGLWWGTAVPYDTIFRQLVVPLRATVKYVIIVIDACHAKGVLHHPSAPTGAGMPHIKGLDLVSGIGNTPEPSQYKIIGPTDVIITACGANQYSYGAFYGGTTNEPWWPTNTAGMSMFTCCFLTSLAEDCCDYTNSGHKLPTIITAAQWRCSNMMRSWGPGAGWLMQKPAYPIPTIGFRKGSQVPPNILTL